MKMQKLLSVLLVLSVLACALAFSSNAIPDKGTWVNENWSTISSSKGYITLTPGADNTKINFSWQTPMLNKKAEIQISSSASMANSTSLSVKHSLNLFEGEYTHEATASNLSANTTYYYRYTVSGTWSAVYSFKTSSGDSTRVLFVTDSQLGRSGKSSSDSVLQNDTYGWSKTVELATTANSGINFILSAGDQVEDAGSEKQYTLFESVPQLRNYPIAAAIGNHDYSANNYGYHFNNPNDSTSVIFKNIAGNGYYFLYNDVLFIVLDSNVTIASTHQKILKAAVNAYPNAKWRVVCMHHSPYDANAEKYSASVKARNYAASYFDDYDIDLCLSGHDHYYSRSFMIKDNALTSDRAVNNVYTNPVGTLYVSGNSSSGSNYYSVDTSAISSFSDFSYQTNVPCYSLLDVQGSTMSVTTYETGANAVVDTVSIVK